MENEFDPFLDEETLFEFDDSIFADIDDLTDTNFSDNLDAEEQFLDTTDKILKLNDELAEEIIIKNIEEQLTLKDIEKPNQINYLTAFKNKYAEITPDNFLYDPEALINSLTRVTTLVADGLKDTFGVELGTDLDYTDPKDYLEKLENLYEFLYIRNYKNLLAYFLYKIRKFDTTAYEERIEKEIQEDVFLAQAKKKFKDIRDVAVTHYLSEIIQDIKDETESAFVLFQDIVRLDRFEDVNYFIDEMLVNYGNDIVLNDDKRSAQQYMQILDNIESFSSFKNDVLLKYLEDCELS